MNWKILVPVAVLIFLVVILIMPKKTPTQEELSQLPVQNEVVTPSGGEEQSVASLPPATDNLDDYVTALLQDSSDEQTAADEAMTNDSGLVNLDSQAISDFGQSYGENEI